MKPAGVTSLRTLRRVLGDRPLPYSLSMADSEPGSQVVAGRVGSGQFIARPPHRTFWQWLTRQPRLYEIPAG